MRKALSFDLAEVAAEHGAPAEGRTISGDPQFTTWNFEEVDGLYAGVWESTPGKWRIAYDEWEYCHILSGHSTVASDSGEVWNLKAGDSLIIRPGFSGTWEVIETTRKDYVIRV